MITIHTTNTEDLGKTIVTGLIALLRDKKLDVVLISENPKDLILQFKSEDAHYRAVEEYLYSFNVEYSSRNEESICYLKLAIGTDTLVNATLDCSGQGPRELDYTRGIFVRDSAVPYDLEIRVIPYMEHYLPQVVEIARMFDQIGLKDIAPNPNLPTKEFERVFLQTYENTYIAILKGQVIGFFMFSPRIDEKAWQTNLGNSYVAISPAYWHRGFGEELTKQLFRKAAENKVDIVVFCTTAGSVMHKIAEHCNACRVRQADGYLQFIVATTGSGWANYKKN